MKKGNILIDVQSYLVEVALTENDELKEFYVEYTNSSTVTGNIYKGKVVNILPGLQSAFVDFGSGKNGFLSVEETLAHKTIITEAGVMPSQLDLMPGDYVMVQATKEAIGTKGARLTTNVSLPGRYVVYMPTIDYVGISNKITDEATRERLTEMLGKVKPDGGGLIARTVAGSAKKSEILAEVKRLAALWEKVKAKYDEADDVELIYEDGDLVYRTVRDIFNDNIEAIVCNSPDLCKRIAENAAATQPKLFEKIKYYNRPGDLLADYRVLEQVEKIISPRVQLKSGGSLVFDYTEALTVIDVNTARFVGKENHEETVFRTNLEAAEEIAKQIRLRNIGGIIIVDFIDMYEEENKERVLETLRNAVFFDRMKTRVVGMTGLGLVEITRKKTGREISTVLLDKCEHCQGHALQRSYDYLCRKIMASLKNLLLDRSFTGALVYVNDRVLSHMISSRFFAQAFENEWAGKRIYLVPDNGLEDDFTVKGCRGSAFTVPSKSTLLY